MFIERLLYDVITDGIAILQANPEQIVDFFVSEAFMEQAEAEKLRDLFLATPPSVIHGYARSDSKFPLYAITLGSENEEKTFMGDEGGVLDDGTDLTSTIFSYSFNIMVLAQHPDVCLYLYSLLKQILFAAKPLLVQADLYRVAFSGADLAPDPTWMPAGLFLRRVTLSCSRQYQQAQLSSTLGKAWKIQGVHVTTAGAPGEDPGGVPTNITTFDDGEED